MYVSCVSCLSLSEYITALTAYCSSRHAQPCSTCKGLVAIGKAILDNVYFTLSETFKIVSPGVAYTAKRARRKLLQMPLVAARIGNPAKGKLYSILMEKFSGIDYSKMGVILNGLTLHPTAPNGNTLDKSVVKLLLGIAESDREWTCLRYGICKSSKMTSTALRKKYGFSNIAEHVQQVEDTMSKVQGICKAVLELASIEDKSLLQSLGLLTLCTDDSEEESRRRNR